jgi:glutathione S-transferase
MAKPVLVIGNKNRSSWSLRAWLALEHSGVEFVERIIRLDEPSTARELGEASPTRKVPVLEIDGIRIAESLAICEWAAEKRPSLWPSDSLARALARSVSAEMHSGFVSLRREFPMNVALRTKKEPTAEVRADIARIFEIWRECRGRFGADGPFLFGTFTIADAMYAPVATRFRSYGVELAGDEAAYSNAIFAQPGMAKWCAAAEAEP